MLTTYDTVRNNWTKLNVYPDFKWDVLALDEGQQIKNPSTKIFSCINTLRANFRILITNEPIQNNLEELWALFQFTHQGALLGTYKYFKSKYVKPIMNSRKEHASRKEKTDGIQIQWIKPYLLKRSKEDIEKQSNNGTSIFPSKHDFVVYIKMTLIQSAFYKRYLNLPEIISLKEGNTNPLPELNLLKSICHHPRLMNSGLCAEFRLEPIDRINHETFISESGKMTFLVELVKKMIEENHKCLIFSTFKDILTIIGRILESLPIAYLRSDGDIINIEERQNVIDTFNADSQIKVLLLTPQVGGLGLTFPAADRVIIYDINWNPPVDAQAADRVYKIGQRNNVVTYRLITCGTIDEKIYRRQIYKDSINRQVTGVEEFDTNPYQYFTHGELYRLFDFDDPENSATQRKLDEKHPLQLNGDKYLEDHIKWLKTLKICVGISQHNLLFSQSEGLIGKIKRFFNHFFFGQTILENIIAIFCIVFLSIFICIFVCYSS